VGFVGGLVKAGIAKKVYDEARKPHNQAKLKSAFHKVTSSRRSGGSGGAPGR
jgi:hypothetical protein